MKLSALEKYLGVVSLILIITMSVCFGIALYQLGSGIRPKLKKIESDIFYLGDRDRFALDTLELTLSSLNNHVHERAENNKAVFKH